MQNYINYRVKLMVRKFEDENGFKIKAEINGNPVNAILVAPHQLTESDKEPV